MDYRASLVDALFILHRDCGVHSVLEGCVQRGGNRKGKGAATTEYRGNVQGATVQFDELFRQGEAEAGAFVAPGM